MIMAQLPAKQDQYVKYAEKDSKGRNIAKEIDNVPSNIKEMVEGGTLDNAKPLYFHPISLVNRTELGGAYDFIVSIIIINNDPTAYTRETLKPAIDKIFVAAGARCRFPATGSFISNNTLITAYNIEVISLNDYRLYGLNAAGSTVNIYIDLFSSSLDVYDGVNKIN